MPKTIDGLQVLSTSEVADLVGVHRLTLLRWIREGKIEDAPRDRNGWRIFSPDAVAEVKNYAFSLGGPVGTYQPTLFRRPAPSTSEKTLALALPSGKTPVAGEES